MNCEIYNCNRCYIKEEVKRKYQLVIMVADGATTLGRIYDSFTEAHEAMIELRVLYAKHGVTHHVGYREV